jgi:hypothetical protein
MDDETDAAEIEHHEIPVTEDRMLVVYLPPDTSAEVEMVSIMTQVAADAASRASSGWELASIDTMNIRHAGVVFGQQGSGFETKLAVTALYMRTGGTAA